MTPRIVTYAHRYKRPPKRRKAVALEVPAIVTRARKKWPGSADRPAAPPPANDDPKPTPPTPAAIVTVRSRRHAMHGHLLEDLTAEEANRRADAADALFREIVRRATGKP